MALWAPAVRRHRRPSNPGQPSQPRLGEAFDQPDVLVGRCRRMLGFRGVLTQMIEGDKQAVAAQPFGNFYRVCRGLTGDETGDDVPRVRRGGDEPAQCAHSPTSPAGCGATLGATSMPYMPYMRRAFPGAQATRGAAAGAPRAC